MSSREVRRHVRKRPESDQPKKKTGLSQRPVLYALSIVILVLITVAFVGGPLLSGMGESRGSLVFGTYDGQDIAYRNGNYMASVYQSAADNIRASGQSGNLESQAYQAWRYAFNQTVFHTAILAEMKRSGAWISENRINDSLVEYGPYVAGGVFDQSRYKATPQAEKNVNRNLRREELIHDRYLADLFATDKMSSPERGFLLEMAEVERRYALVAFSFSNLPDSTVVDYGLANRERFRQMKMSRITITSSEREAKEIRERAVSGGSSFDELARSYSKGFFADKGGDMGWQNQYDLEVFFDTAEAVQEIFELKEGEISRVLPSGESWAFFRADSDVVEADLENPETVQSVRSFILSNEVGVAEEYYLGIAGEFAEAARADGFTKASLDFGAFPPAETEYAPLNYGSVFPLKPLRIQGEDQAILAGGERDEELFGALYALGDGEVSKPVLLGDRILVATLLDERTAPAEDQEINESILDRVVLQILQQDLSEVIIDEEKLVDNFQTVFFTKLYNTQ